jgi:aminopeptidase N
MLSAHSHQCSSAGKNKSAAKNTSATVEEDYYDVTHVNYNLAMSNISTNISGIVRTTAKVVSPLDIYAFELDQQLTIDQITINGTPVSLSNLSTNGYVRKLTLGSTLPVNSTLIAQVSYHGQPTNGTGFFTRGLNQVQLSSGTNIMYTLSDMYTAKDWWPCKQNINDKIDSVDIFITVPDSLKAGSNGLLISVTPPQAGTRGFYWKSNYPIDYYLISVAVAPYADYSYYMHFTDGSGDSMLIQNYVYDSLSFMTPARKAALDGTGATVDHFSKLFGKYPFYKEKYGHCMAEPLGGGMEHQTMTTLAYAQPTLIAHELGHQWWGDNVTYGSWADIWLSEGFATYCEQLYTEQFVGIADAKTLRTTTFNKVINGIGTNGGTVFVDDTTSTSRVFDSRLTYAKGASVAHMLRYMAPQDNLFFNVLRTYQQQFAYGHAITSDLQQIAEQTYGIDLDTFFNQWIYLEGYPTYSVKWYQNGNKFYLNISQTTSKPTSVPYFAMPVELKLKSASGDTTINLYNSSASQYYNLEIDRVITGLEVDPENHILNKVGAITNDPTVGISVKNLLHVEISPNPSSDGWVVKNIPQNARLVLTNIEGKLLWQSVASDSVYIPAQHLPKGHYLLTITMQDSVSHNYKLAK